MNEKYRTHLFQLKFDITRRCNLNCKICMRGNAQNQDITQDIIDKTLAEVKDCYISAIQISGGEPFLNPDMFEYLINKIIENRIAFGSLGIYTNGTIKDDRIKKALSKITIYLKYISGRFEEYIDFHKRFAHNAYKQSDKQKVFLIISTHYHDTSSTDLDRTIDFYNSINNDGFCVVKDGSDFNSMYLTGNAYENRKELLPEYINVDNYKFTCSIYDFIKNYNYSEYSSNSICDTFLAKTLSVSTNGNVYAGVSWSYDDIDFIPMFNILDCKNNFLNMVSRWCWQRPVNSRISSLRNKHCVCQWFIENGYEIDLSKEELQLLNSMIHYTNIHEIEAKELHQKFPQLCHTEIDCITSAKMPLVLKCRGIDDDMILCYLKLCTIFPDEVTETNYNAFAREYIGNLLERHNIALSDVL